MDANIKAVGSTFRDAASGTEFMLHRPVPVDAGEWMVACLTANGQGDLVIPSGWMLHSRVYDEGSSTSEWVLLRLTQATDPSSWVAATRIAVSHRAAVVYTPSDALIAQCSQPATDEEIRASFPEAWTV